MSHRTACVNTIKINSILSSSIFSVGDSSIINPSSKVLAIQRENPIFYENEGDFNAYPLFSKTIEKPNINESIEVTTIQKSQFIKVNKINILSISAGAVFQVGNTEIIDNEARIKHFRQLIHL